MGFLALGAEGVAHGRANSFPRTGRDAARLRESCREFQLSRPERDQWSYSQLVEPEEGGAPIYRLLFVSDPDYAARFRESAERRLVSAGDHQAERLFSFRPARGKESAQGRLFVWNLPRAQQQVGKLSGVLAVQLTMSRSGEVLGKKLLFTTNTALGAQVLAAITDWITVASPGADLGPFEDLLYLDFEAGALSMASQSHYRASTAVPGPMLRLPSGSLP